MLATERIHVRTTADTKAMIEKVCQRLGVSVSSFIIQTAYEKALALESELEAVQLNEQQWQQALAMLENPPKANDELNRLFSRGYQVVSHS